MVQLLEKWEGVAGRLVEQRRRISFLQNAEDWDQESWRE